MKRLKIKKIAWKDFVFAKRPGSSAEKRSSVDYFAFQQEKARLRPLRRMRTASISRAEFTGAVL